MFVVTQFAARETLQDGAIGDDEQRHVIEGDRCVDLSRGNRSPWSGEMCFAGLGNAEAFRSQSYH